VREVARKHVEWEYTHCEIILKQLKAAEEVEATTDTLSSDQTELRLGEERSRQRLRHAHQTQFSFCSLTKPDAVLAHMSKKPVSFSRSNKKVFRFQEEEERIPASALNQLNLRA
jgi:hypothetical protein